MGALSIAFDTVIAGALALPWVVLVIYLFFPDGADQVRKLRDWSQPISQSAALGVLLFAVAYTLGSAVSRIAQDFFNDDDLNFAVDSHQFRVGATEDRIRTSVYCGELFDEQVLRAEGDAYLKSKVHDFRNYGYPLCWQVLRWSASIDEQKDDDDLIATTFDIFSYQENSLLLQGEESTLRLRQLHDQIMVLRGAAFNGVIAFSLCCFAWGAALRREKPSSRELRVLQSLPLVYLVMFAIAVINHLSERAISAPPYMEFILLLIGGAGAWLLWTHPGRYLVKAGFLIAAAGALHHYECLSVNQPCMALTQFCIGEGVLLAATAVGALLVWKYEAKIPAPYGEPWPQHSQPATSQKEILCGSEKWAGLVLLAFLLTSAASLGWWSSEVLYTQQVIYSYKALTNTPSHPASSIGK